MILGEPFLDEENNVWVLELTRQRLCKLESNMKLTAKAAFESQFLPIRTIKVNGLYYALSIRSYQIIQCDCLQHKVEYIGIEESAPYLWSNFIADRTGIWFVPQGIGGNLEYYDLREHVFKVDYQFKRQLKKYCQDSEILTAFTCNYGQYIIGAIYGTSYIYRYHIGTKKFDINNIGNGRKICSVIYDGKFYWITQLGTNEILRWEPSNQNVEEIYIPGDLCERPYGRLFIKDGKVIILPSLGKRLVVIDTVSVEVNCFKVPKAYVKNSNSFSSLVFIWGIVDEKILFSSTFDSDIFLVLNLNTMSLYTQRIVWKSFSFSIESHLKEAGSILYEGMDSWCKLNDYCQSLGKIEEMENSKSTNPMNKIGSRIYQALLQ